ncbi:MAG: hypothetical protein EBR82_35025 [Caulobacteraceae bacterium]|nr:hypothetical protein [Caulobacteraceae bacterium]
MLIDELKSLAARSAVKGCIVGVWEREQDKEFQEVLGVLKQSPNLNYSEALTIIKKHYTDLPFKRTSFIQHLKGNCQCQTA